jgi:hypothetical protein
MLFDCFISYLYMRVLKLTLFFFFCIFPSVFQLLVWSIWTDMFLRPDALDSVNLLSDSMPSGRVCTTSESEPFAFSAKHTHTTFWMFYHVVMCVFSLRLIPRFWHSLHVTFSSLLVLFVVLRIFFVLFMRTSQVHVSSLQFISTPGMFLYSFTNSC